MAEFIIVCFPRQYLLKTLQLCLFEYQTNFVQIEEIACASVYTLTLDFPASHPQS